MNRTFFHYKDLEEYKGGLWKIVRGKKRKENMEAAARLMKSFDEFCAAMRSAMRQWPNSMLFNLGASGTNKIAFLGHAGCCVGVGSPEENTRCAWHTLTNKEQDLANNAAALVLSEWKTSTIQYELFDA